MKFFCAAVLFTLLSSAGFSQSINFEDGFEDGEFTQNPTWSGADSNFVVINESGNNLLQLNDNQAFTSFLSTPSTNTEGEWEFFVRFYEFEPSDGNRAEIYLMSDISDLTGNLNGYKLRGGENTSSDVFRLIRVTNGAEDGEVLAGTTSISNGGGFRVKVTRDSSGNWTLEVARGYTGTLAQEATGTDNTYTSSSFFGLKAIYTTSRSTLFFFDFKIDIPPIQLTGARVISNTEIDVSFSQPVDPATVQTSDFSISNSIGAPSSVQVTAADTVRLTFNSAIPGGNYTLTVNDIDDSTGQTTIAANSTTSFFLFDEFAPGDVIINEFLKDPPPGSGLEEYVELRNLSSKILNLKNWQIGDNGTLTSLSDTNFVLLPDSFLVVTTDTNAIQNNFSTNVYLQEASLPAFNNTTDQIRVFAADGNSVDSLRYTPEWGGVDVALERRSATAASIFRENWTDSPNAEFGTPGRANEVTQDNTPPALESFSFLNDSTLRVIFTERVLEEPAEFIDNYSIIVPTSNDFGAPGFESLTYIEPRTVRISFNSAFRGDADGEGFAIEIANQEDIFGNVNTAISFEFSFQEFATADSGDVVLNEFMYDPADNFTEFMELFNNSDSTFDVQGWTINDNTGNRNSINSSFAIEPGGFLVIAPDSSLLELFPDIPLISLSDLPAFNNSGDDIVIRNENGILLDSLRYTSEFGGDEVSLERRDPTAPTVRANFGDSPSPNLATPGAQNEIEDDTSAPELQTVTALNDSTVRLIYTEQILEEPAENLNNYELFVQVKAQNDSRFQSAILFPPDTVIINFEPGTIDPFSGMVDEFMAVYDLEIQNQSDILGNVNPQINAQFSLIETLPSDSGDVVLNEFMYDPADGFTEFIEIQSLVDGFIDLNGWTLNDNSGNREVIIDEEFIVSLGNYIILAPDSSLLELFPGRTLIDMGSRFPNLNNSGDDIVIRNENGILLDSLRYTSEFGGDEVSLERRSSFAPTVRENFGDSPSPNLATPGAQNEIADDNEAPELLNISVFTQSSIRLSFDERLQSGPARDESNYTITPNLNINTISVGDGETVLSFENPLVSGQEYTITVTNQADIFGNVLASATGSVTFLETVPAMRDQVVINEILYRRASATSPEFVELFNRSEDNFDLSGWTFSDASSSATIPDGTTLEAGAYLVLTDMENFADSLDNGLFLGSFPSLNDSGDQLVLKNDSEETIDSLFYQDFWGGDIEGFTVEKRSPSGPSNDPANWETSTNSGGSAGAENSVFENDTSSPEIIFARLSGGNIFVAFSEFIRLTDQTQFFVSANEAAVLQFDSTAANTILIQNPLAADASEGTITANNLQDFNGNISAEATTPIAFPLIPGSVIINEILFDPLANDDDNLPDQTEYVELFNPGSRAISLEGFFLHDAPDEDGEIRPLFPEFTQFTSIAPGQYILVYAEDETADFDESQLAEFFELGSEVSAAQTILIDRSSLSLSASDDAIFLSDSAGTTIDSVFYDESWHNPNRFDSDGVSLERIDPSGPSNSERNWSSSTDVRGGTPGTPNSILQEPGQVPENVGISFDPNPFSPSDQDGFQDNLFINYTLDEPDYLLRVRIFDRYGRLVKTLEDGTPAGFEGSLMWDGLTDNGNQNRVGYYIVFFEARNSANGEDITFKETVVIARRF